jgi:hypothetical protein
MQSVKNVKSNGLNEAAKNFSTPKRAVFDSCKIASYTAGQRRLKKPLAKSVDE